MNDFCFKYAKFLDKHRWLFWILSFTWGIVVTLIGLVISLFMLIIGRKPHKYNGIWYFEIGKCWGGFNMGPMFITDCDSDDMTRGHENGHGFQNCLFGPFQLLVVAIPSALRWWLYEFKTQTKRYLFGIGISLLCTILCVGGIVPALAFNIWWLLGICSGILLYVIIISVWFIGIEIPKFGKGYVPYSSFWAEANADRIGKYINEK